jgi:LytS/YehU family sensor histidine kinase
LSIPPDALGVLVPNFLLQPLVENAVRHGIAPHARNGHIKVAAAREPSALLLRITDSGDGVPEHRLTLLNQGVGLANTRARLEHLYPGAFSLTFSNTRDGFQVAIRIPIPAAQASAAEPDEAEIA